jgi:hypothetical protein
VAGVGSERGRATSGRPRGGWEEWEEEDATGEENEKKNLFSIFGFKDLIYEY